MTMCNSTLFTEILYSFSPLYRFVSLGPRLSSFVLDTDDGNLDISDSMKLLPLHGDKTIQICGYPLHGLDTKLLFDIPPNVLINEYGIEVQRSARKIASIMVYCLFWKNVENLIFKIFHWNAFLCSMYAYYGWNKEVWRRGVFKYWHHVRFASDNMRELNDRVGTCIWVCTTKSSSLTVTCISDNGYCETFMYIGLHSLFLVRSYALNSSTFVLQADYEFRRFCTPLSEKG